MSHFLRFSKTGTYLLIRNTGIFLKFDSHKNGKFGSTRAAKFSFQKNHKDLKKEYLFFENFSSTFLLPQRTSDKKKLRNKKKLKHFVASKLGNFFTGPKIIFREFLFIFSPEITPL